VTIFRFLVVTAACAFLILGIPAHGLCSDTVLDGSQLSVVWALPFFGLLLSIALWPVINPQFWEAHYGKITAVWSTFLVVGLLTQVAPQILLHEVLETVFNTYLPFVILLVALFAVTGGIHLQGNLAGTPLINTGIIFVATALASWVGTTGASMLFIRPLLRANMYRRYRAHSVIFFIVLAANVGGSLTPLGDPPIFLGFLAGMDFFWTTIHMFGPMTFLVISLLLVHYLLDAYLYRKEDHELLERHRDQTVTFKLEGWQVNLPLLLGIAGSVLLSGTWKPGIQIHLFGGVSMELQNIVRDFLLLTIVVLSGRLTDFSIRERNAFTWDPMREVAKLFLGIFICLIPILAILKAGKDGDLGFLVDILHTEDGKPDNIMYFWMTGLLSTLLDNAPTFLVFFNIAGGDAQILMNEMSQTLLAILCGTVFMGANTYVSNAPNLMVRSLAENLGVRMPSFFAYTGIVLGMLLPPLFIFTLIWLR
jgi:Na+/H+ antiporter NhaD/arsenite permease-like protein